MGFEGLIIALNHSEVFRSKSSMPMKFFIFLYGLLAMGLQAKERPNILWFVADDMSANFSSIRLIESQS